MTTLSLDPGFLDQVTFEPLNKGNWKKFVRLFGDNGACGNCWCMYYRLKKTDFAQGKTGDGNKRAMKKNCLAKQACRASCLLQRRGNRMVRICTA